jgi:hypothetical protein
VPEGSGDRDLPRLALWVALGGIAMSLLLSYVIWDRAVVSANANLADAGELLSESIADSVERIGDQLVAVTVAARSEFDMVTFIAGGVPARSRVGCRVGGTRRGGRPY